MLLPSPCFVSIQVSEGVTVLFDQKLVSVDVKSEMVACSRVLLAFCYRF